MKRIISLLTVCLLLAALCLPVGAQGAQGYTLPATLTVGTASPQEPTASAVLRFPDLPDGVARLAERYAGQHGGAPRLVVAIIQVESGFDAKAVKRTGDAAEAIAAYAGENADLIVMGSHGWGKFKSAVLGSTAAKVGAATELPILIIRSDKDELLV